MIRKHRSLRISTKVLLSLLAAVSPAGEKSSLKTCLLCQQIVSEILPDDGKAADIIRPHDPGRVNRDHMPLYLIQGEKLGCLDHSFSEAIRWLCTQGFDLDSQRKAFMFIVSVSMLHTKLATEKVVLTTSEQLSKWLMSASLHQAANPYTLNPFRKDESNLVTEVDGTPSRNFFTVLNIGQYYTDDQLLNIYTFSLLYRWLYHTHQTLGESNEVIEETSQGRESVVSMAESPRRSGTPQSGSSTGSPRRPGTPVFADKGRQSKVFGALSSRTVDYCFRVLDQCERKPKVSSDAELQMACLSEAVTILDFICRIDEGKVPRVHQEVKRLYSRISTDSLYAPIVIQILQFFVNHSSTVVHDPGDALQHYFGQVLAHNFRDPGVAFDTVRFILQNLEVLCHRTSILATFFPNILKLLAWHPRTFVSEFLDILPALMSPSTAMEVFHTVLDLPCVTAALEVIEKAKKSENVSDGLPATVEPSNAIEAFQHPIYRPLFTFITRYDSGHGDTIDKLASLHNVLSDMKSHPRVVVCSQAIPVVIRVWFSVILDEVDETFANQLLPVMLERSALLYGIPEFQSDIKRLFSENLVSLLRKYPAIVTNQYTEISSFLMSTRSFSNREDIFSNLVWCVGEFCSLHHDSGCTSDQIAKYYETFEAMTYEVSGMLVSAEHKQEVGPKIVSVLISAIAKLSTRCQDLIPRAILCLTKVAKQHYNNTFDPDGSEALVSRAYELINLLKLPNFASVVLNPAADIDTGRWHRDNTSLPVILRGTYRLLSPDSK